MCIYRWRSIFRGRLEGKEETGASTSPSSSALELFHLVFIISTSSRVRRQASPTTSAANNRRRNLRLLLRFYHPPPITPSPSSFIFISSSTSSRRRRRLLHKKSPATVTCGFSSIKAIAAATIFIKEYIIKHRRHLLGLASTTTVKTSTTAR
jgi:hypothetical protein